LAVPVKLIVPWDCVSRKVKALPFTAPDIDAVAPHEVSFPVKVACPLTPTPSCVRLAVAWRAVAEPVGVRVKIQVPVMAGLDAGLHAVRKPTTTSKAIRTTFTQRS